MEKKAVFFTTLLFIIPFATPIRGMGKNTQSLQSQKLDSTKKTTLATATPLDSSNATLVYRDIPEPETSLITNLTSLFSITKATEPYDIIGFLESLKENEVVTNNLKNQAKTCTYIDYLVANNEIAKIQKLGALARKKKSNVPQLTLDETARRALRKAHDKELKTAKELIDGTLQKSIKTLVANYTMLYKNYDEMSESKKNCFGENSDDEDEATSYPKPDNLEKAFNSLELFKQPDTQQQSK